MKATLEDCKKTFQIGYEAYEESRIEAEEVRDLYHNRHYTSQQLHDLTMREQPRETYNVVKMITRMLIGYYSTIVNTVVVRPRNPRDITTATLLNDVINYIFEENRFDIEGEQIKLNGLLSGLLVSYVEVVDSDEKDMFGRTIKKVKVNHVPEYEIVLDPDSVADDYSDAKYVHHFKWMRKSDVEQIFGKSVVKKLDAYVNHLNITEAEFDYHTQTHVPYRHSNHTLGASGSFQSFYRMYDQFLIVHTVIEADDGKTYSIYWHDNVELFRKEITYRIAKFPYRIQKLHSSNKREYYGIFREIIESQKAINQAVIQIQLMCNSSKAYVQHGAVEDLEEFQVLFNRVNSVIPVIDLNGVRVDEMSKDVQEQYILIDKALERIYRMLGINDSFLGMAMASDSGRKVKLQQGATIMSLRYITSRIESFYRSLSMDIAELVKQFYTSYQVIRVTDQITGDRWQALNSPIMKPTGQVDAETGEPELEPVMVIALDQDNGDMLEDENGNIMLEPVPRAETEVAFTKYDIKIESSAFNDEDEKGQLMLESVMSGQIGQMLAQVNPAGFFKIASLAMKTLGTKHSPEISRIIDETSMQLQASFESQQEASLMAQGASGRSGSAPKSQSQKLPQNTNE